MVGPGARPARYPSRPVADSPPSSPPPSPAGPASTSFAARSKKYLRRLGPAAVLAAGAATLPLLGSVVLFRYINVISAFLKERGDAGVGIYVSGFAVFSGMAFLPTYASAVLGGWAFGFHVGLAAAMIGFAGGALIGYLIARGVSRDRVQSIVDEHPRWVAVRDSLLGRGFWKTFLIVFLLRLPSSPFAATNLALASLKVSLAPYMLGTVLGMLPRTAVTVFLASQIEGALNKKAADVAEPWWFIGVGIAVAVGVAVTLSAMANRALARVTGQGKTVPPAAPARDAA